MLHNAKPKENLFENFYLLSKHIRKLAIRYMIDEIKLYLKIKTATQLRNYFRNQQLLAPNSLEIIYKNSKRSWRNAVLGCAMKESTLKKIHKYNPKFTESIFHPLWYVLDQVDQTRIHIADSLIDSYKNFNKQPLKSIFISQRVSHGNFYYHIDKKQNIDALVALLIIIFNHPFYKKQYVSRVMAINAMIISLSLNRPFQSIGKEVYYLIQKINHRKSLYNSDDASRFTDQFSNKKPYCAEVNREKKSYSYLVQTAPFKSFSDELKNLELEIKILNHFYPQYNKNISKEWLGFCILRSDLDEFKSKRLIFNVIKRERKIISNQSKNSWYDSET